MIFKDLGYFFFLLLISVIVLEHLPSYPKYNVGDCVDMTVMDIDNNDVWTSSGYLLGTFKIIDILNSNKPNTWMAEHYHANQFYVVKMIDIDTKKFKDGRSVIPVEDLDHFRYADGFWQLDGENNFNCNKY